MLLAAFVLYLTLLVATMVYALRKGGETERLGAITLLIAIILSELASNLGPRSFQGSGGPATDIDMMVIDLGLFIAFVIIAYRSTKFWPIWAAASQLVAVLTHWVFILDPSVVRTAYATAQPFWVFPMLGAIAIGTRTHQRSLQ